MMWIGLAGLVAVPGEISVHPDEIDLLSGLSLFPFRNGLS